VCDSSFTCPSDDKAAHYVTPLTHKMRHAAELYIHHKQLICIVDAATGVLTCPTMADSTNSYDISVYTNYCSCQDYKQHGVCCHLIAVEMLPSYDGVVCTGPFDIRVDLDKAIDLEGNTVRRRQARVEEPLSAVCTTTLDITTHSEGVRVELQSMEENTQGKVGTFKHRITTCVMGSSVSHIAAMLQNAEGWLHEWESSILRQSIPYTQARVQTSPNRAWSRQEGADRVVHPLYKGGAVSPNRA
jgi:hypothetical protein